MGGAKAQYGIVKGEVKAPTLSAVGKFLFYFTVLVCFCIKKKTYQNP